MALVKGFTTVLWLLIVGGLVVVTGQQNLQIAQSNYNPVSPPPFARLKPSVVDIVTMGHRGVVDDFMHLWMLQIFTTKDLAKTYGEQLHETVSLVAAQKIKIESFYLIACFFMSNEMERPSDCESILLSGLQVFPDSWRIPMVMGYMYNFKLNEPAKAAAMYGIASSRPDSPPYVIGVTKKLINKEQVTQSEIEQTMELMSQVPGGRSRFAEILKFRQSEGQTPPQGGALQ